MYAMAVRRFVLAHSESRFMMPKKFLAYKDRISATASRVLEEEMPFKMSFSHYLILSRIKDDKREDVLRA